MVLLHGAFMAITFHWPVWISELSKTRKVIAIEMQGTGAQPISNATLLTRTSLTMWPGLLDFLERSERADIIGYSLGGGVAMECAIRHRKK